jgi:hypothetical protein
LRGTSAGRSHRFHYCADGGRNPNQLGRSSGNGTIQLAQAYLSFGGATFARRIVSLPYVRASAVGRTAGARRLFE